MQHLTTLCDIAPAKIEQIFATTEDLKQKYAHGVREPILPGRVMALVFEKPSLRTRVSFEAAISHLGGRSLFLGEDAGFGTRETIADFGRVLSQYVDVIVVRAKQHETVMALAQHAKCSVVNGLTNRAHPCQALSDLFTLRERLGTLSGHKLTYVGDGNNVARSLAIGCGKVGMRLTLASPKGYQFADDFLTLLQQQIPHIELEVTHDPAEAVRDAAAIYTDVWASMGQEKQRDARLRDFAPYQVNRQLMKFAPRDSCFMHCLPARRGEEVTDEVIDGPQSIVLDQAANRMHVQKGILAWLLTDDGEI